MYQCFDGRGGGGVEHFQHFQIIFGKPLMSSGSKLALLNCDIYSLSPLTYDPEKKDKIFIRAISDLT
jgi:hypothetical protein